MSKIKWARIESCFESLFSETKSLSKKSVNSIGKEFDRHFTARTALAASKRGNNIKEFFLSAETIELGVL